MSSFNSIAPIILAAGDSTRMGFHKALLPFGSENFIRHILRTVCAAGLPKATVVLGRAASLIRPHVLDYRPDILINPDPGRGQLSSIRIALSNLGPDIDAAMIWPVDMPAVPTDLVRRLAELFIESGALISCPQYGDRRGHPAIYHRSLFQEFMDAPLSEGPKKILPRHRMDTSILQALESTTVKDIDTPSDYRDLTGEDLDSALAGKNS